MRSQWGAALLLAGALAGCGTTVPLAARGSAQDGLASPPAISNGLGRTGSTTGTGGAAASGTGASGAGSAGSAGSSGSGSSGLTGTSGAGSTTSGAGSPTALPPIEIGTYYLDGGNAALAAAGFAGLVIPDNKPVFDAFVRYINEHGGLAGRRIAPVYYVYNEGADPVAQDAQACATFTQDHHVFLVIGGINSGAGQLLPCLAKHDVPLISAATGGDKKFFAQYHRYAYEPGQLNYNDGFALLIDNLRQRGYLSGVHKVGVVQYPGAIYDRAVDDGLAPALRRVGLKLDARVTTSSATDSSAIASSSAGAVLKFSTAHIDLVLFMSPGGAAETYFMTTAEQQAYKPKYGIWSPDSPSILATTAPGHQLAGTIGVGWLPGLDVGTQQDPTARTPTAKACLAMGKRLGLDESGLGNPLIRTTCDVFTTLLAAIGKDPATTRSTALLERGFDAIGTSIPAASTFGMRWVPGHHDAAAAYRDLRFDSGCGSSGCFAYGSVTKKIG
jgi:hypothetical protein